MEPPSLPTESGTRRFASNALWLIAAEVVAKLASFVFVVIVARGLGPVAYGYFNLAISLGGMFIVFGSLGVKTIVTAELVRRREDASATFSNALVGRVAMDLVALVAAVAIAPLLVEESTAVATIAIVGAALFLDDITSLIGSVFKAAEKMRYHALGLLVNRIVSTGLAVGVVVAGGDIITVALVYLVGSGSGTAFAVISLVRNFPELKFSGVSREGIVGLMRAGAPLGIGAVLNQAVFRLDSILLQVLRGPVSVAMYGVAFRFFDSLTFLAYSVTSAAEPRFAHGPASEKPIKAFQLSSALILSAYLPIAAGAPFAGRWVVVSIFSERYEAAAGSTAWLAAAVLFFGIAYLARIAAIAIGRRKEIPLIAAAVLGLNVVLNLILIPRLGFEGAAIATFATEVLEMILILGVLKRALPDLKPSPVLSVPLVATAVMVGVLLATGARDLAALVMGTPAYLVALVGAGLVLAPEQSRRALSVLGPRAARRSG